MASLIDKPSSAMRLARTIVSDIMLYNKEKVVEGVAGDDLFNRLADEIDEGRRHFESRTTAEVRASHPFFDRALVDVLVYRSAQHPGTGW